MTAAVWTDLFLAVGVMANAVGLTYAGRRLSRLERRDRG